MRGTASAAFWRSWRGVWSEMGWGTKTQESWAKSGEAPSWEAWKAACFWKASE